MLDTGYSMMICIFRPVRMSSSIEHPASSIQNRVSSIEHPVSSIEHRVSKIEYHASSIQYPASSIEHRASSIQYRASSIQYRASSITPLINGSNHQQYFWQRRACRNAWPWRPYPLKPPDDQYSVLFSLPAFCR